MRTAASLLPRSLRVLEVLGVALVGVAVLWWAVVYGQVIANTGMAPQRTLPCLLRTSDLCSLAMSLCKEWHFLGIRRYSAQLFWIGAGVCLVSAGGAFVLRPRAR